MERFYPEIGSKLDHFSIQKQLGEGTYGVVFKSVDHRDNQTYALKLLKLWEIIEERDRDMVRKRFEGEFKTGQMQSLYLVTTRFMGQAKGNPYFTMDFMANGDLRNKIGSFRDFAAIDRLGAEILLGLRDLHTNGVIHRDIKPENVMLDENMHARLSDFGIAGYMNARLTVPGYFKKVREIFGSYAYIAPEQLQDFKKFESTGPVTDLFSFGVMMYELITGVYPFGNLNSHADLANYIKNAREESYRPIEQVRKDTPEHWRRIIRACLMKDHKRRVSSTDMLLSMIPNLKQISIDPNAGQYDFFQDVLELVVTNGEETNRVYPLSRFIPIDKDGLVRIGWFDPTEPNRNHIEIRETITSYVSNFHATFEKHITPRKWYIRDGQYRRDGDRWIWKVSTNGVFLNGRKIDAGGAEIRPGDIITLGDTALKIRKGIR